MFSIDPSGSISDHVTQIQIVTNFFLPSDHGVNIRSQGGALGIALQGTAFLDNGSVVKYLLDRGGINAYGGPHGNTLP